LAVRDYSGSGQPVVLLPGAGRTLADLGPLAGQLTASHRVVAMDYRNHGWSTDAEWTFEEVVADVKAVVDHYRFDRPAIVGHSLGGMVAAMYATAFPDHTLAAVNLDGHGFGTADQYVGIDPVGWQERFAQLRMVSEQIAAPPPMTGEQLTEARGAIERQSLPVGVPPAVAREAFDRALAVLPDGTYRTRPLPERIRPMLAEIEKLNMFELWERTPRPLLIYNATKPDTRLAAASGLEWTVDFMSAYRVGLTRDLSALSKRKPSVRVIAIDATHALVFEQPRLIGGQIAEFLASVA
jgi:pimeloyl-ACP methyl ester carboxylesterase